MSDKTEQPTPKRLREAREKGDLCRSQEIPIAATVLILVIYLVIMGQDIYEKMIVMFTLVFETFHLPYNEAIGKIYSIVIRVFADIVFPILFLVMGSALVANLSQIGFLFSVKSAIPKLENISPSKWFKKVFSLKNGVELLKNTLKVAIIGYFVYYVLQSYMSSFFKIQTTSIAILWAIICDAIRDLLLYTSIAFCIISALDYLFQRWQYTKKHLMSKDEIKREYKEMEGDPYIKSKRKQLYKEMLAQNSINNVRKAKVLVVNPTHYAVALDYEKDKTPLPLVLAKGEGELAKRMIKVAEEEGIPIMRNVPLARSLYQNAEENEYIPADLIQPVAEVIRWVQSLKK